MSILRLIAVALFTSWYGIKAQLYGLRDATWSFAPWMSRQWGITVQKLCRMTVRVINADRYTPGGSYIVVANHTSLLDIPALMGSMELSLRFVYKKELEKIPIFGTMLRKSPYIAVERDNARQGMETVITAVQELDAGQCVVVFAEGTRSKDGTLAPFKRGAFMTAARSRRPLLPVAIVGTHGVLPSGTFSLHPGVVELRIGQPYTQPIETREQELAAMKELHRRINEMLPEQMKTKE